MAGRSRRGEDKEVPAMFWNEPNPYGYTYREVPNIPTPFFGQTLPKYVPFAMTPWTTPQIPQFAPFPPVPQMAQFPQVPHPAPFPGVPQMAQFPQVPQFPTIPQIPQIPQFYGMNLPVNPVTPPLTQFPTILPLALYGLPYRPF
jgi:homeobox protein ESX1